MPTPEEVAFARAWCGLRPDGSVDERFRSRLLSLGRAFAKACGLDAEDLLQRVALRILERGIHTLDQNELLRIAERMMKGWRANERNSGRVKYMTQFKRTDADDDEDANVPEDGQVPSSQNPQNVNIAKERHELREDVFDDADAELQDKGGAIADRAREILALLRQDVSDTGELCERLGLDETKIYKARMLLADVLEKILARRGLTLEAVLQP